MRLDTVTSLASLGRRPVPTVSTRCVSYKYPADTIWQFILVSQEAPCVLENFSVLEVEDRSEAEAESAPVRPPRRARKKLKHLSLDGDTSLHEDSHQNDILFRTDSSVKLNRDNQCLKGTASHHRLDPILKCVLSGNILVLTLTTAGLRSQWKQRWASYDPSLCKIKLFKVIIQVPKILFI